MKRSSKLAVIVLAVALLGSALRAPAQISVRTNGTGQLTFDTQPTVASGWSTLSVGTLAGTFTSTASLDAAVISNTLASAITGPLTADGTVPPAVNATARWNNTAFYLQTRPNGNDYTLLMATLRNETGFNVTQIRVRYDWDQKNPVPVNEDIPGHRAYFSHSGARGSWNLVPALSTFTTTSLAQIVSADIPLGVWTNGGLLYLIWADDNGPQEGGYTIDNFSAAVPTVPVITAQPESQSVAPGGSTSLSVSVFGAEPLSYRWLKDSNLIANATNAGLTIQNAQAVDQAFYSVIVSNMFGTAASSNAFLSVTCATAVAVSIQPTGRVAVEGSTFALSVGVTGTLPIAYQWLKNGTPVPGATNSTLSFSNAQLADTAFYSVAMQNCAGTAVSTSVVVSVALPSYALLPLTNHIWKYDDFGNDLGSSWRAADYDDSFWISGRGLLAFENSALITPLINTELRLTNAAGARFITYYFRTSFTLTNNPSDVVLVSSNYIDDGSAVYVNGAEAFRFNLPEGPLMANTLALSANPLGEGVAFVSNIASGLFLQGTNVLAAEVRQNTTASSDVVFGMQLTVVPLPPTPLAFTNHPADRAVLEGGATTFTAAISGNNARFQWFKDGAAINGATRSSLSLDNIGTSDAGSYVLQASNLFGVVYSRLATLTVLLDRTPPGLVSAELLDSTHIRATFSEPVQINTATNLANYSVTNTLGAEVSILRVVLTNQTNVVLTTAALSESENYILTEYGVTDNGPAHNVSPGSAVPVARQLQLLAFDSTWDFLDPYPPIDDPAPGAGWKEDGYDTSTWGSGAGAFSYSTQGTFAPPVTVNTTLSPTPVYASYYRAPFAFNGSPGGLTLSMRHAFDDSAVFYLNGQELHRTNLPAGIISPETRALVTLNSAYLSSNIVVVSDSLRPGQNLFAVEVHQVATNDSDKFFAMELLARIESFATGPVLILAGPTDIAVGENTAATFSVRTVGASTFQWLMNGTNLPGATNATLKIDPVPLAWHGSTFSIIAQGPGGTVPSSNAVLHVWPDGQRPELLAALGSNNTMTLSFSELLDATTALDAANYVVTNFSGSVLVIQGVTLVNGNIVVLQFDSLPFGRYGVVVNNVRDASVAANVIRPNSAVLSGFTGPLLPIDASWRYYQAGASPGTNWQRSEFDDSAWLGGRALFYAVRSGVFPALPEPVRTTLMLSNAANTAQVVTYYFRTNVQSASAGNATLSIRTILDDGLVLYLNGVEIFRHRMPAGTPTYNTLANANAATAYEGPFIAQATNFVMGTNLLAVEVHQASTGSSDVGFALELEATLPGEKIIVAEPASPPNVRLLKWGNQFVVTWDDSSALLESAENLAGPWLPVNQSNPVFISPTNAAAFYRLRR